MYFNQSWCSYFCQCATVHRNGQLPVSQVPCIFLGIPLIIHFEMAECRSEMKALIIMPVASRYRNAFWCPMNSILELLPASFAWWTKLLLINQSNLVLNCYSSYFFSKPKPFLLSCFCVCYFYNFTFQYCLLVTFTNLYKNDVNNEAHCTAKYGVCTILCWMAHAVMSAITCQCHLFSV